MTQRRQLQKPAYRYTLTQADMAKSTNQNIRMIAGDGFYVRPSKTAPLAKDVSRATTQIDAFGYNVDKRIFDALEPSRRETISIEDLASQIEANELIPSPVKRSTLDALNRAYTQDCVQTATMALTSCHENSSSPYQLVPDITLAATDYHAKISLIGSTLVATEANFSISASFNDKANREVFEGGEVAVIKGSIQIEMELCPISPDHYNQMLIRQLEEEQAKKKTHAIQTGTRSKKNTERFDSLQRQIADSKNYPRYLFKVTAIKTDSSYLRDSLLSKTLPDFTQEKYKGQVVIPTLEGRIAKLRATDKKSDEKAISKTAKNQHEDAPIVLSKIKDICQTEPKKGSRLKAFGWSVLGVFTAAASFVAAAVAFTFLTPILTAATGPAGPVLAAGIAGAIMSAGAAGTIACFGKARNEYNNYRAHKKYIAAKKALGPIPVQSEQQAERAAVRPSRTRQVAPSHAPARPRLQIDTFASREDSKLESKSPKNQSPKSTSPSSASVLSHLSLDTTYESRVDSKTDSHVSRSRVSFSSPKSSPSRESSESPVSTPKSSATTPRRSPTNGQGVFDRAAQVPGVVVETQTPERVVSASPKSSS